MIQNDKPAAVSTKVATTPPRVAVLAILAYFFFKLRGDLLNASLFPLVTGVFPFARDVITLSQALMSIALLTIALRRPSLFAHPALSWGSLAASVVGFALTLFGAQRAGSMGLSLLGSLLMGVGTSWLGTLALLACCFLRTRTMIVALPTAMAVSRTCTGAIAAAGAPDALPETLCAISILCLFACSYPLLRSDLSKIAHGPLPSDAAITQPSSFLPITSTLFVSLLLLKVAYGFTLRFNVSDGVIPTTAVTVITLVVLACLGGLDNSPRSSESAPHRRSRYFDALFSVSVLLFCLGFLVLPIASYPRLAADLLAASSACANVLIDCVLVATARRNMFASVAVLCTGSTFTSTGVTLGANLGLLAGTGTGGDGTLLICALVAGALLAYTLFVMRGFSFGDTIEGIEPVREVTIPQEVATAQPTTEEALASACEAFARERALSPRELDILKLLARGRNNAYIQEELVLSRNTVKSHIRHVYTKLDVHSQQELIDLVEERLAGEKAT